MNIYTKGVRNRSPFNPFDEEAHVRHLQRTGRVVIGHGCSGKTNPGGVELGREVTQGMPTMGEFKPQVSECSDCGGSGKYVGLTVTEDCKKCGGSGKS